MGDDQNPCSFYIIAFNRFGQIHGVLQYFLLIGSIEICDQSKHMDLCSFFLIDHISKVASIMYKIFSDRPKFITDK